MRGKNSMGAHNYAVNSEQGRIWEIRGLEIWVTMTLSSASFTRREDTRPWTAKCSAQGWPQNYSHEKSPKSPVSGISSAIPIARRRLIEPQRILLKGIGRAKNAGEGRTTKETTIIVSEHDHRQIAVLPWHGVVHQGLPAESWNKHKLADCVSTRRRTKRRDHLRGGRDQRNRPAPLRPTRYWSRNQGSQGRKDPSGHKDPSGYEKHGQRHLLRHSQ